MRMTWKRRTGVGVLAACALALLPARADGRARARHSCRPTTRSPSGLQRAGRLWWQWALSIPEPVNPLTDTTGEDCAQGQFKPLWFLAGKLDSTPVERTCTIPAGRFLFFPAANVFEANRPRRHPDVRDRARPARADAAAATGTVMIDGRDGRALLRGDHCTRSA